MNRLEEKSGESLNEVFEIHPQFIEALADGPIEKLEELEERSYQKAALEAIRQGFLKGAKAGTLEIGTGGGKTAVAFNLISKLPGKVLWLAPSNAALFRALEEADNLKLKREYKIVNGGDLDLETDIVFATSQMLMNKEKFKKFAEDHFSLIVFDEGHHAMGKSTRKMFDYFKAFELYLTATPETTVNHLDKFAPSFFRYGSEELIKNDNFPFWVLKRYEVTGERINEAKVIGDNYALSEGQDEQILNMPHRYAITLKVLREAVGSGEKAIGFLPSVTASRKFVEEFIETDSLLKGKVVHVDGSMDKRVVKEIAEQFKEGKILAVCCNDLLNESLNIPDIKHILLADPCCSPRVLTQRIGRGARPAQHKEFLTIHDIVSAVANLDMQKGQMPLTVAGKMNVRRCADNVVLNGEQKGKVLFEEIGATERKVRFVENTEVECEEISFRERLIDLSFMNRADLAVKLYKKFAEVLQTPLFNLVYSSGGFLKRKEEIKIEYAGGAEVMINFSDAVEAVKLYGMEEALKEAVKEDVESLCEGFNGKIKKVLGNKIGVVEKSERDRSGKFEQSDYSERKVESGEESLQTNEKVNYLYHLEVDKSTAELAKYDQYWPGDVRGKEPLGNFAVLNSFERTMLDTIQKAFRENLFNSPVIRLMPGENVQRIFKILLLSGLAPIVQNRKDGRVLRVDFVRRDVLKRNSKKKVYLKMISREGKIEFGEEFASKSSELLSEIKASVESRNRELIKIAEAKWDAFLSEKGGFYFKALHNRPVEMQIFRDILEVRAMGKNNILWTSKYFNEHFDEMMFVLSVLTEKLETWQKQRRLLSINKRNDLGPEELVELKIDFIDLQIEEEKIEESSPSVDGFDKEYFVNSASILDRLNGKIVREILKVLSKQGSFVTPALPENSNQVTIVNWLQINGFEVAVKGSNDLEVKFDKERFERLQNAPKVQIEMARDLRTDPLYYDPEVSNLNFTKKIFHLSFDLRLELNKEECDWTKVSQLRENLTLRIFFDLKDEKQREIFKEMIERRSKGEKEMIWEAEYFQKNYGNITTVLSVFINNYGFNPKFQSEQNRILKMKKVQNNGREQVVLDIEFIEVKLENENNF